MTPIGIPSLLASPNKKVYLFHFEYRLELDHEGSTKAVGLVMVALLAAYEDNRIEEGAIQVGIAISKRTTNPPSKT